MVLGGSPALRLAHGKLVSLVLDLIEAGMIERTFIRQALRQAVDRGLITRQKIRNARMSGPGRKIVEEVMRRVA